MAVDTFRLHPGRLMKISLDDMTGFNYEIWFPYTQELILNLKPGDLVAVPNFASNSTTSKESILEIIQVLPAHFALNSDLGGYPGFLEQAAESASQDWETQTTKSTEAATKIRCLAIPTDISISHPVTLLDATPISIASEAQTPMPGKEVRLLSPSIVSQIYNQNLATGSTIRLGSLTKERSVTIEARTEDLIKTHVGIFGYTGTGKSNLLSSLVSNMLAYKGESVKIMLFDLMGEYVTLLMDELLSKGQLIVIGEETLPGPVVEYLKTREKNLRQKAEESFLNHILFPKGLRNKKKEFLPSIKKLLDSNRIKFYTRFGSETVASVFEKSAASATILDRRKSQADRDHLKKWASRVLDKRANDVLNSQLIGEIVEELEKDLEDLPEKVQDVAKLLISDFKDSKKRKTEIPSSIQTYLPRIIGELNKEGDNELYVIIASQSDQLREFSNWICMRMYDERRTHGLISPLNFFVFDEADEFIPQDQQNESYERSSEAVETIARRGRKFGMGVCIATQRVTYLNTSILAQPHTYFVSRLPRESDRQRVTDAFGLSDNMMRETFRFSKGDWLVVSHDATGLQGVPIPIHSPNAEERLKSNLLAL